MDIKSDSLCGLIPRKITFTSIIPAKAWGIKRMARSPPGGKEEPEKNRRPVQARALREKTPDTRGDSGDGIRWIVTSRAARPIAPLRGFCVFIDIFPGAALGLPLATLLRPLQGRKKRPTPSRSRGTGATYSKGRCPLALRRTRLRLGFSSERTRLRLTFSLAKTPSCSACAEPQKRQRRRPSP
jgi:hypothetical protein